MLCFISCQQPYRILESHTPPLFDRLPPGIFRPLAAAYSQRYWEILCRLMSEMWGDGGRSPGEEARKSTVIRTVESFLVAGEPWGDAEGSVTTRAHGIFNFLCESGWLTLRRRGVIDHVTVRPAIAQFFTVLTDFAQQEPEFLTSKVQSIFLSLREVSGGKAPGLYAEAARQAKQCMAHIANTSCRIQDLMDELVTKTSAREFVRGFFEDYIEKVFIADYSDFRTNNHPLQYRSQIIGLTLQFQHDLGVRKTLIEWYAEKQTKGDLVRAEASFERDTRQLLRLRDVEVHLRRLDDEIRVAHQRAMAFFEYKMRSPGNFDKLIGRSISASNVLEEGHIALPGASGIYHASEFGLSKPRTPPREPESTEVEVFIPSIEDRAREWLRQQMNAERNVTPLKLAQYVARHFGEKTAIRSDELSIVSINDLCCYQRLLLIASRDSCPPNKRKADPHLQMVPGMHVEFVIEARTGNAYIEHQRFVIQTEKT